MKKTGIALLALLAPLAFGACDDTGSTGPSESEVTVLLTDAPGDVVSAVVTVDGIYLQGGSEAEADADAQGRVWLTETPVTTDLLTLANDALTLVDDAVVPAGSYGQLRFVVSGGYVEVEQDDGSTEIYASQGYDHVPAGRTVDGRLQMPSLGQTGIKVDFGGDLHLDDEQEVLLIDFDVSQSFGHQAGQSGMWVMSPVIHGADLEVTSSLTVEVSMAESVDLPVVGEAALTPADLTLVLENDAGDVKEAALEADGDGTFSAEFPFLMPGTDWRLSLRGPEGTSLDFEADVALPLDITPTSGESRTVELTITSVTVVGAGA